MKTELIAPGAPALSAKAMADIDLFCKIAKSNGAILSLKEIIKLVSLELTEKELEHAWNLSQGLQKYRIDSGLIMDARQDQCHADSISKKKFTEHLSRADQNIFFAKKFGEFCGRANLRLLSISGSTSYLSASEGDDLDFFCITQKDSLWLFLCKSLILGRLFKMKEEGAPPLCFSCVMDEAYAEREFTAQKDALFARDAISAIVIRGEAFYRDLLRRSNWMASYLPKLYRLRIGQSHKGTEVTSSTGSSPILLTITNSFLFYTVGTYIRLKSCLLNRQFAKKGKLNRAFKVRLGKDHCIFESSKYKALQQAYANLRRDKN